MTEKRGYPPDPGPEYRGGAWTAIALLLFVALAALLSRCSTAHAQPADPPLLLRIDAPATAYTSDGAAITLPAGTEIDLCAAGTTALRYELDSRTVRIPAPCGPRVGIFADGFEQQP